MKDEGNNGRPKVVICKLHDTELASPTRTYSQWRLLQVHLEGQSLTSHKEKRHVVLEEGVILHHDNAPVHKC